MNLRFASTLIVLMLIVMTAGCGSSRQHAAALADPSPALVLPVETPFEAGASSGDEAYLAMVSGRNDDRLGAPPQEIDWGYAEIRHREFLRIVNGRPNDFSSTVTRTIRSSRGR